MERNTAFTPTIFDALRKYPLVVLGFAALFAVLSYAAALLVWNDWVASTQILIEDPSASQVFNTSSSTRPERYVASQVAIIQSRDMAEAVSELVGDDALSPQSIREGLDVTATLDTDVIEVSFRHGDAASTVDYANSFGIAYQEYRNEVMASSYDSALDGLDESIAAVDRELAQIEREIAEASQSTGEFQFEQELEAAIQRFLATDPGPDSADVLEGMLNQLQSLQIIRTLETQNPGLALLQENRREAIDRRSQLVIRRDQLQVDFFLASDGVVAISEATEADRSTSPARTLVAGAALGAILGSAIAYGLLVRNRRFEHRAEPEAVLGIPLLSEVPKFIPSFTTSHSDRLLPVLSDTTSPPAEAFRFAANAIAARLRQLNATPERTPHVLAFTSALLADGKTIVTANTALSVAAKGKSVLLLDADFGDPSLTRLLMDQTPPDEGITDVLEGETTLAETVFPIKVEGGQVDLLTRGTVDIAAADLFDSAQAVNLFKLLKGKYDYVMIDCPPLLQVSYTTNVVQLADAVVAVIPHQSRVAVQIELLDRMDLIGAQAIGYIYNKAPKRSEMFERRGSMLDPIGAGQSVRPHPPINTLIPDGKSHE